MVPKGNAAYCKLCANIIFIRKELIDELKD
jgi:hypothetical protein